jgi:hypothetical protein
MLVLVLAGIDKDRRQKYKDKGFAARLIQDPVGADVRRL